MTIEELKKKLDLLDFSLVTTSDNEVFIYGFTTVEITEKFVRAFTDGKMWMMFEKSMFEKIIDSLSEIFKGAIERADLSEHAFDELTDIYEKSLKYNV